MRSRLFCLLIAFVVPVAAQAKTGLATWNLEWLMDQAVHARWVAACSAAGWLQASELQAEGPSALPLLRSLKGLPYCNVHDGLDHRRRDACIAALGDAARLRPGSADTANGRCRVAPDLADWNAYAVKLRTLRETFRQMERDGITLVALQEVFNEDAVRQILPSGWDTVTSASLPGAPAIPQHVGVAWKTGTHRPVNFTLVRELSAAGERERPLRPGLQFTLKLGRRNVDFLVVHLKAGCRSAVINKPRSMGEQAACPLLAQQVRHVEHWIDARAGRDFVILGDFNRTLLAEMAQVPQPDPSRFGANPVDAISLMAPEWNDDQPRGSRIRVIPHKRRDDGRLLAGDYFCAQTVGIDHIVFSESLWRRHEPSEGGLELLPVSYRLDGKRLPVARTTVPPSDHCARFVRLR